MNKYYIMMQYCYNYDIKGIDTYQLVILSTILIQHRCNSELNLMHREVTNYINFSLKYLQ